MNITVGRLHLVMAAHLDPVSSAARPELTHAYNREQARRDVELDRARWDRTRWLTGPHPR